MRIEYDDNGYPYYVNDGNENTYDTKTGKTYRPDGSVAVESDGTEVPPPAPPDPPERPAPTPPPPPPTTGNGYILAQLKAAWLGAAGRYAPTRAGLAQFIADNKGPGGFAEGVTIGGSKMNKLWLGPVSTGTYLGDVIGATDSNNPYHDWDTSTGSDTPPPPPMRPPPTIAPFIASGGGFPTFTPPSPLQLPDPFTYPDYVAPDKFAYDAYTLAQPFSYEAFQAPTGESIYSDPSYQFRLDQGAKALEASAANRGTLRTGGHLKNLEGYAQNFASQEYGNIYNRAAQQYGLNRTNAKDIYTTNEGNRASAYDTNYNTAKDIYGINAAGQLGSYNTNLANAKNAYQSKTDTANALYGSQYKTAQDQFDAQQKIAELQFGREWDAYKYANDDAYRYWNTQLGADTQKYGYDVNNL